MKFSDTSNTIRLADGRRWHFARGPDNTISLEAIAHSLSCLPRYTGHAKLVNGNVYTVAEHSVKVSLICETLEALMHDATEAVVNDISRPLKHFMRASAGSLRSPYDRIEEDAHIAIARQYDLQYPMDGDVKTADNLMLVIESAHLMDTWQWEPPFAELVKTAAALESSMPALAPQGWSTGAAKALFIARFNALQRKQRGAA